MMVIRNDGISAIIVLINEVVAGGETVEKLENSETSITLRVGPNPIITGDFIGQCCYFSDNDSNSADNSDIVPRATDTSTS